MYPAAPRGLWYCLCLCMLVWHHGGMGGTMCPDDTEGGMVSGGGLEYIVIRPPESTVVSRPPWDLSPLPPPPPESGEVSPTPNGASCGDGPLGRFRPIRALLRGGEEVTESAGEPPPEDPLAGPVR